MLTQKSNWCVNIKCTTSNVTIETSFQWSYWLIDIGKITAKYPRQNSRHHVLPRVLVWLWLWVLVCNINAISTGPSLHFHIDASLFFKFQKQGSVEKLTWPCPLLCIVIEPALHAPCQCLLSTIAMPEMEDYIFANRTHHVYRDLPHSWAGASQADDLQLKYEVLILTRHRMIKVNQSFKNYIE